MKNKKEKKLIREMSLKSVKDPNFYHHLSHHQLKITIEWLKKVKWEDSVLMILLKISNQGNYILDNMKELKIILILSKKLELMLQPLQWVFGKHVKVNNFKWTLKI